MGEERDGIRHSGSVSVLVRAGVAAWAVVGIGLVGYGVVLVLRPLRLVLVSLTVAALLGVILEPVVVRLVRAGLPRWAAVSTAYAAVLVPTALGAWSLVQVAWEQLQVLVRDAPSLLTRAGDAVDQAWERLQAWGVPLPASDPFEWMRLTGELVARWVGRGIGGAARVAGFVLAVMAGFVLGFPLLVSLPRLRADLLTLTPARRRREIEAWMRIVGEVVGRFVRGQLVIAVIVGILSGLGLRILGVPWAILVGTVAGATNLVPYIGPIVGSAIGIVLGLAEGGVWLAWWVFVLFFAVQQFESYILGPLIVGRAVRVPAFVLMVGILVGASVAGIAGMLLAAPLLGAVKAVQERSRTLQGRIESGQT